MNFTGHNILLDNGQTTMGPKETLIADSALWTSIEKTINLFMPQPKADRSHMRVVDLGCLEGGYTVQFARMGFDTLGIEAREENVQKCNYVKSNLSLPNLNFVQDDARNISKYGKFDITLCYGLLYHLNDPFQFLKTLHSCTSRLLFLSTHYAPERDIRYISEPLNKYLIIPLEKRIKRLDYKKNYRLSKLTQNEGYRGRWYTEWNENEEKNTIEKKLLWSSYNNDKSFWLCKKDLTIALHDAGFNSVFEQFDFTGDVAPENYSRYYNRSMFVAVRH
jgi:SAM-dependent methyltransferase